MIICPNFSNPEVAREFEELKNATSEAAAYHIWSLNNGNAIDKAPNGAESKLFQTLLEYYGDRTKAIQAKAKVYGNSFLNWFGDWTGNATYEVYQGRASELPDGRRYNYWSRYENEAKTYGSNVRKVRINPTRFLFKNEQRWRTNLNGERVFDWGWSEEYEKVFAEFKEKTGYDYFDILENSKEGLAKQNEFFEFLESKGYKGYAEFNELELQGVEHDNAYTVTFGNNGVIDSDVSKVVDENGEPLVVWHGGYLTDNNSMPDPTYIEDSYDEWGEPFPGRKLNPGIWFTTDKEYANNFSSLKHPCFLNIKHPHYGDDLYSSVAAEIKYLEDNIVSEEDIIAAGGKTDGLIGHDGKTWGGATTEEMKNDPRFGGPIPKLSEGVEFAIYYPNQAKSIDNQGTTPWEGTYSRENDDIYYQENSKDVAKFNKLYLYEYNTDYQELQNWSDDMTKPERELYFKDYLKSLRDTLNCK